jgi:hypothetical protein
MIRWTMSNEQRNVPFIDPRAHRTQLAFVGALLIVAAVTGSAVPLWIGALTFTIATVHYPRTSLPIQAFDKTIGRARPARILVDARPSRMMCVLTVPTLVALGLLVLTIPTAGRIVAGLFGAAYLVECAIGRCVTCESYRRMAERGIVHPNPPLQDDCLVSFR